MKGSSGSKLSLKGDFLKKTCKDSFDQVRWFKESYSSLVQGVIVPEVSLISNSEYLVEFFPWSLGTQCHQTWFIHLLLSQVERWSHTPSTSTADWESYLQRLESHVSEQTSPQMTAAFKLICDSSPFPSTFCHGDLTLENVLVNDTRVVLIDPNFKPSLFQSYLLDLGKLLQSTYAEYHKCFNCNHGCSLEEHNKILIKWLKRRDLEKESKLSCLSHVIRLKKYRPDSEKPLVDSMLAHLIKDFS